MNPIFQWTKKLKNDNTLHILAIIRKHKFILMVPFLIDN